MLGGFIKSYIRKKLYEHNGIKIEDPRKVAKDLKAESPMALYGSPIVGKNVSIGKHTFMRDGRIYHNTKIGRYCSIGVNVFIGLPEHPMDNLSTHPLQFDFKEMEFPSNKQTIIGNDVWIGNNVCIKSGIKVGDGAVIGACSAVVKDVPAYAIVGGVPAKFIRYRFEPKIIEELLLVKWWDKDISDLKGLNFEDVADCLYRLKENHA